MLPPDAPPPVADDYATFSHYYVTCFDPIRKFIAKRIPSGIADWERRAEDLAQDAFVKAWKYWADFEERKPNGRVAWLYQIANRVFLDEIRHLRLVEMRAWNDYSDPLPMTTEDVAHHRPRFLTAPVADQPEDVVVTRELAQQVRAVLDGLPPRYAHILFLREYADLSYDEIAEHLDTTRAGVKSMLYRARETVRQHTGLAAYARQSEPPPLDDAILAVMHGAPPLRAFRIHRRVQRQSDRSVDVSAFTATLDRLVAHGRIQPTPDGFVAVQHA